MSNPNKKDVAKSTLCAYDLTRLNKDEVYTLLTTLFNSDKYVEMMKRRNLVFKSLGGAVNGSVNGSSHYLAFKELEGIDKKVKDFIFNTLVIYDKDKQKANSSRKVTLHQYRNDFVKTKEQQKMYEEFTTKLDVASFLGDMMESILIDAQEALRHLDPTCILSETNAIQRAVEPLHAYTSVHHKNSVPELLDVFCDYSDKVYDKLYPLCAMFVRDYKNKVSELQALGKIDDDCKPLKY